MNKVLMVRLVSWRVRLRWGSRLAWMNVSAAAAQATLQKGREVNCGVIFTYEQSFGNKETAHLLNIASAIYILYIGDVWLSVLVQ